MEPTQNAPKGWKVVIALIDEQGNVKLQKEIDAPKEEKSISFAIKGTGYAKDGGEQARPKVLEWKVDELFKAVKADGTEARINGKAAGFQVKAVLRFSDYEVQLAHKNREHVAKPLAKGAVDM